MVKGDRGMAKKIKKAVNLTDSEVNAIVDERTGFDDILSIKTGLKASVNEDGTYSTEEEAVLLEEDVVRVVFNKKVRDRIQKYGPKLLSMRGVKNIDTIDQNDYDVKKLYDEWVKRTGKRRILRADKERQLSVSIEMVKRQHRPQYMLLMMQIFSWAVIRDDVFTVVNGALNSKLDIEIPDGYWEQELPNDDDVDTDLDKLFEKFEPPKVKFDKTIPFELMIAISSELLRQNDEFSEAMQDYFTKVFAGFTITTSDDDYDDAGFLHNKLDELLSKVDDRDD
jgi:hypothetical protein